MIKYYNDNNKTNIEYGQTANVSTGKTFKKFTKKKKNEKKRIFDLLLTSKT